MGKKLNSNVSSTQYLHDQLFFLKKRQWLHTLITGSHNLRTCKFIYEVPSMLERYYYHVLSLKYESNVVVSNLQSDTNNVL